MMFSVKAIIFLISSVSTVSVAYPSQIDVMVYETDVSNNAAAQILAQQINGRVNDITVTVFGQGRTYAGFGSKFSAVLPLLKEKDPNTLVVISDSRDVLINNPSSDAQYANVLASEFRMHYEQLTFEHPNAIVASAESQCCVSALTHVEPGQYFNKDGSRNKRSCQSGTSDCMWNGDSAAQPWEAFMKQLMNDRLKSNGMEVSTFQDMYLNAGLIAGTAKNLIRVIEAAQIDDKEDDQAVLTDFMYHNPNEILLDYQQVMFGSNRGAVEQLSTSEERCPFTKVDGESRLHHTVVNSSPLFIHSPGGYYECHDQLAHLLGVPVVTTLSKDATANLRSRNLTSCNYGKCALPARTQTDLEKFLFGRRR